MTVHLSIREAMGLIWAGDVGLVIRLTVRILDKMLVPHRFLALTAKL